MSDADKYNISCTLQQIMVEFHKYVTESRPGFSERSVTEKPNMKAVKGGSYAYQPSFTRSSDHSCRSGCPAHRSLFLVEEAPEETGRVSGTDAAKQSVQMLIIDKKMLPIRESGLPQAAIDQTPKYLRRSKVPIVKARVQGKIMTLIADSKVFPVIPVKKEVKATISGLYIMDVRAIRGQLEQPPQKKKWYQKLKRKAEDAQKGLSSSKSSGRSSRTSSGKKPKKK